MGVPVVSFPSEAESQCVELASLGKVYAAGSEDMDIFTIAKPNLHPHLIVFEARNQLMYRVDFGQVENGRAYSI